MYAPGDDCAKGSDRQPRKTSEACLLSCLEPKRTTPKQKGMTWMTGEKAREGRERRVRAKYSIRTFENAIARLRPWHH